MKQTIRAAFVAVTLFSSVAMAHVVEGEPEGLELLASDEIVPLIAGDVEVVEITEPTIFEARSPSPVQTLLPVLWALCLSYAALVLGTSTYRAFIGNRRTLVPASQQ